MVHQRQHLGTLLAYPVRSLKRIRAGGSNKNQVKIEKAKYQET